MLECCRQDTKEAMICIDNKNGFIELTNFYQIDHNFSYFSTKPSRVTGSILNWGLWVVQLPILHTLTRYVVNLTESSCKLIEKCFSYIIKELLNWYWWILARGGRKNARACNWISKPTSANIHQYQFNNSIII